MIRLDENRRIPSYSAAMGDEGAHVRFRLETKQPIALSDFVSAFIGVGSQFEKFVAREHPDLKADSEFFVKEVRSGSIEADLVAWVQQMAPAAIFVAPHAIDYIDKAQILEKFVNDLRARLGTYFRPNGRIDDASKGDLSDFLKTTAAIANDPDGAAELEAAAFEDGKRKVRAAFKFKTKEARAAEQQISDHRRAMENVSAADHERVLMHFVRPSIELTKTHKRTGERAIIEAIHPKALAVVYASDLARERVFHEMREAESNIFRVVFDVDVNVEMMNGRPVAYRIMHVHSVIDAPDDDDES